MSELIALAESSIKNKSARLCKSLSVPDSTGYSNKIRIKQNEKCHLLNE